MGQEYREDWIERAHRLAVRILGLANKLPRTPVGFTVAGQLTRSALSIPYNLEEAKAANTQPDTLSKTAIARKESSETRRALLVIRDVGFLLPSSDESELRSLIEESTQFAAMLTSGVIRLQARIQQSQRPRRKPT